MNVSDFIEKVNVIKDDPTYKNIAELILEVHRRSYDEGTEKAFILGYTAGYRQGMNEGYVDGKLGNPMGTTGILGVD